jgi:type I restriction-modification system DNA methylase subunit
MLNDFAEAFGWRPSESFFAPEVSDIASAHILVEHGLENTAVLTFLRSPRSYSELDILQRERLLAISYNNLVDWHIPIGVSEVCTVYNRVRQAGDAGIISSNRLTNQSLQYLRSEIFEQITGKRPTPNVPALDDALISTISKWRRILSSELQMVVAIEDLSALFNAIIFARAVEDHTNRFHRRLNGHTRSEPGREKILVKFWDEMGDGNAKINNVIHQAIAHFTNSNNLPRYLVDDERIKAFDNVSSDTIRQLLTEFYRSPAVPYPYDFSVMSKHALSRIYEHYVSLLRYVETLQPNQLSMFSDFTLPEEEKSKAYGSIYTPQFIARFFAKYLREKLPRGVFLKALATDPACGSGIFLRTLLEVRFDSNLNEITTEFVQDSLNQMTGIDIDFNAVQATRLSLALLSLALTDTFPAALNVEPSEGVEFHLHHPELKESQDAVLANPPFVAIESQPEAIRERIGMFMSGLASGRVDMFLPFLRIGYELLKPGGIGLFVLPHSFLLSDSGKQMRALLAQHCWILCLADLSSIRVFGNVQSYAILLIFQKKRTGTNEEPPAVIAKCQDMVGRALQDVLDHKYSENEAYSVYPIEQAIFKADRWIILPPTENALRTQFNQLPTIDRYLQVRQGFLSGADDVFIVSAEQVKHLELEDQMFVPYLADREMTYYTVPKKTDKYFFFPYIQGRYITEIELKKQFSNTWNYLRSKISILKARNTVKRGELDWWKPHRPRSPEEMLRPKIVTPHLVIVPRFAIDMHGRYAVSHSPYLYPREKELEREFLLYFTAVLNSQACFWYITAHSHVYQRNYAMLEVKTLLKTPVPDPASIESKVLRRLISLVEKRLGTSGELALKIEKKIDAIVADCYGLTDRQRRAIGAIE